MIAVTSQCYLWRELDIRHMLLFCLLTPSASWGCPTVVESRPCLDLTRKHIKGRTCHLGSGSWPAQNMESGPYLWGKGLLIHLCSELQQSNLVLAVPLGPLSVCYVHMYGFYPVSVLVWPNYCLYEESNTHILLIWQFYSTLWPF